MKNKEKSFFLKKIEELKEQVAIQRSDGHWNYDRYSLGMANGIIYALYLFEGGYPKYLKAPDVWLKNIVNKENVV